MKYTKTIIFLAIFIAILAMAPSFTFAIETQDNGTTAGTISTPPTQDNGSTAGSSPAPVPSTPATQDNGTTAGTISTPATQNNGSTAGSISTPATQNNGTTAGISAPATQNNGTTAGTGSNTSTSNPSTGTGSGGSSVSSGGGSSVGSGGSSSSSLSLLALANQCNYISADYLRMGQVNSVDQVNRLQLFLKTTEGFNVNVTGIFDQKTFDAVSAFQLKYMSDVLTPWGLTKPTGNVYTTTRKKINEIYCKATFSLTSAQIAEIQAYRTPTKTVVTPVSTIAKTDAKTVDAKDAVKVDETKKDETQVAGVAKTSIASKIWKFIKNIFGR